MKKRWKISGLLPIALSAFVFFGACGNEPKIEPKPNNQEEPSEPKETEPFKAFPEATSKTNSIMEDVSQYFQAYIDAKGSPGSVAAIVTPTGVTIKGFGTFAAEKDPGSINFELASITKVFVGMAFASMVNDGILKLDTKLADCKPKDLDIEVPDITLGQLTSHTSGLPMDMKGIVNGDMNDTVFYTKTTDKELWEGLKTTKRSKSKIGKYEYSNYGVALLGSALAHCDNEANWFKVVEKRVLKPLGLEGMSTTVKVTDGFSPNLDKIGWNWESIDAGAHAALRGNAKQLARLAQMIMSKDNFIGHKMIKKSLEHTYEFANPATDYYSAVGYNWLIGFHNAFADYVWRDENEDEFLDGLIDVFFAMIHHEGGSAGHETSIVVSQDPPMAIIYLNNSRAGSYVSAYDVVALAFGHAFGMGDVEEYADMMEGYKNFFTPAVIELSAAQKERFLGDYKLTIQGQSMVATVSLDASSDLWFGIDTWGDDQYRAWPIAENTLTSPVGKFIFTLPEDITEPASVLTFQEYDFLRVKD